MQSNGEVIGVPQMWFMNFDNALSLFSEAMHNWEIIPEGLRTEICLDANIFLFDVCNKISILKDDLLIGPKDLEFLEKMLVELQGMSDSIFKIMEIDFTQGIADFKEVLQEIIVRVQK